MKDKKTNEENAEVIETEATEVETEEVAEETEKESKASLIKDKAVKLGKGALKVITTGLSILGGITAAVMIKDGISGHKRHDYLEDLDDIDVPADVEENAEEIEE